MMSMQMILKEKRKALGYTQAQIAERLGVTTPAVNKWENGITCPDIMLLPALACLLETDPNTLLCFNEELSQQEIGLFLNEVVETVQGEGIERGFEKAFKKTREYPNCIELLHNVALMLEGTVMMTALPQEEEDIYIDKIGLLYEMVAKSDDPVYAERARYMLASRLLKQKKYDKAQEMLDLLPEWNALDKRGMQADLWMRRGEDQKAAQMLERKLLVSFQDQQAAICQLIRINIQESNEENALALAAGAKKICAAFELGEYWENLAPLEAASARKDGPETLKEIKIMLEALKKPAPLGFSPYFVHLLDKKMAEGVGNYMLMMIPPLVSAMKNNDEYKFLHEIPEFWELISEYEQEEREAY